MLASGLLLAWGRGFVEQVAAPPGARHIVAQQLRRSRDEEVAIHES